MSPSEESAMLAGSRGSGTVVIRVGVPPAAGRLKIPEVPAVTKRVEPSGETLNSIGPANAVPKGGPLASVVGLPPVTGRLKMAPA